MSSQCQSQLPGPLEQHGGQLQRSVRQNIAFVSLDIAQKLPQSLRIGDGRVMAAARRRQARCAGIDEVPSGLQRTAI